MLVCFVFEFMSVVYDSEDKRGELERGGMNEDISTHCGLRQLWAALALIVIWRQWSFD
jgi:hypothetical protein